MHKVFKVIFDILLSQINDELPICSVVTGDLNTGCSRWWRNDITYFAGKESFNWRKAFESLSVDSKVDLLNKTLLNKFRNYIPNKKIKCDYRQPPWMTDDIKKSLKERSKLRKIYYKDGQQKIDYDKVLEKSADCTKKITQAKNDYINKMTDKIKNPSTAPKTYWSILSCLLYKKRDSSNTTTVG